MLQELGKKGTEIVFDGLKNHSNIKYGDTMYINIILTHTCNLIVVEYNSKIIVFPIVNLEGVNEWNFIL